MIKIHSIDHFIRNENRIKKGSLHLCHYPNGSLATFVRNMIGQGLVFDSGVNGRPTRLAEKFAQSKTYWK